MAVTKYALWERKSRAFVGGASPNLFDTAQNASDHAADRMQKSQQADRVPQPVFDVISLTVNT